MRMSSARLIEWRRLLTIVKPDTLIRWHRKGFVLALEIKRGRAGRRLPQTYAN
jgi:hypothetical protein